MLYLVKVLKLEERLVIVCRERERWYDLLFWIKVWCIGYCLLGGKFCVKGCSDWIVLRVGVLKEVVEVIRIDWRFGLNFFLF